MHVDVFTWRFIIADTALDRLADLLGDFLAPDTTSELVGAFRDAIDERIDERLEQSERATDVAVRGLIRDSERRVDDRTLAVVHAVLGGDFDRIAAARRHADRGTDAKADGNAAAARADDPTDRDADVITIPKPNAKRNAVVRSTPFSGRYAVEYTFDGDAEPRTLIAGSGAECERVRSAISVAYDRGFADRFYAAARDRGLAVSDAKRERILGAIYDALPGSEPKSAVAKTISHRVIDIVTEPDP